MQQEQFDIWALIELFGHTRIAGRVHERTIGGASFLQVDVPDTKVNPAFTRLLNPSAIYAINPVTEDVAKHYAEKLQVQPIESWDIHKFMEKSEQRRLELAAGKRDDEYAGDPEEEEEEHD